MTSLQMETVLPDEVQPGQVVKAIRALCKTKFGFELDIQIRKAITIKVNKGAKPKPKVSVFHINIPRTGITMNGLVSLVTSLRTQKLITEPRLISI